MYYKMCNYLSLMHRDYRWWRWMTETAGQHRIEIERGSVITSSLTLEVLSPRTSLLFPGCAGRQAPHWASLPW